MKSTPEDAAATVRAPWWRWPVRVAKFVALAWLFGVIMLTLLQRWILFPRHMASPRPEVADQIDGLEVLWLDTDAGRVEGWFIPADDATVDRPAPLVIYAHGNGELIDWWPEALARYREMGFSLLLPEYRGYGRSAGSPSEAAIQDDFVAFYDTVTARPDVDAERVAYHGRSLGGGALAALAREREPHALILESTFTSVPDIVRGYFIPGFVVMDRFETAEWLAGYGGPTLVIHGRNDGVVPFSHGRELARVAVDSTFLDRDCGHNDCPRDVTYWHAIASHLAPIAPTY